MTTLIKATPTRVIAAHKDRVAPLARSAALGAWDKTFPAAWRGCRRCALGYNNWLFQHEFRDSSRTAGSWHKDADHHRARIKQNFIITGVGLGVLAIASLIMWFWYPDQIATVAGFLASALVLMGWKRSEGKTSKRKVPGLMGITNEQLNDVFIKAGVHKKDEEVVIVEWPHRDGKGVSLTVDLAPGRTAADAIKAKASIASWLHLQETGLVLTRVRGSGGHSGRLSMWAMPGDPFEEGSGKHPVLSEQIWNVWQGSPFGIDARGREISLRLIGSHMLIGAAPNAGKSYAGRSAAAPFLLDPGAQIYIADGKGSDTWAAARSCAAAYISDALRPDDAALRLSRMLDAVIAELQQRNAEKITGTKLSELRSRDAADPVPLLLIIIDELQEFTGNAAQDPDSDDKKQTIGKTISAKLMQLGKLYRSAGAILLLLTQRPDDDALPKGLRAVLMTRFALRTRDRWNSDMILGPDFSSRGYSTADDGDGEGLLSGVGILVPDTGADPDAAKGYPLLRTYEVDDDDWAAVCARGAALRGRDADAELHPGAEPAEGDAERFNPGAEGSGTAAPLSPGGPLTGPAAQSAALPGNVIALRDYLLRPGNEFRATFELLQELGIEDARELARMMRNLGQEPKRDWIYDKLAGKKRQVAGYYVGPTLQAIAGMEAKMAA